MPTCDDHYQSVPNTITKPKPKRDRGYRTAVTFFGEDSLFVLLCTICTDAKRDP